MQKTHLIAILVRHPAIAAGLFDARLAAKFLATALQGCQGKL
jgi:hypothetical protein